MTTTRQNRLAWTLANVCRLLLAVTFLFSGFVKLNDPLGTQYKIEDYAHAFGLAALAPQPVPLVLSVVLAMLEFCLGVWLFFGINRRRSVALALLLMAVFTPLTLYLAIANPVQDCGCFGDALLLTNWQTFWKNVLLLCAALVLLRYGRLITRFVTSRNQWLITLYSWFFAFVFALLNIHGLPLIDFRPYHIGADICEKMGIAQGADAQYETTFIMEKDGQRQEFTLENYPDSTWTFIDSRTVLVGGNDAQPEIHDFSITTIGGGQRDITQEFLADTAFKFLLVSPYIEQADDGVMDRVATIHDYCLAHGYSFLCLTSSSEEAIARWQDMTGAEYPFCHTDAIALKTMVRSNPGLLLLKGSRVVNKWPSSAFPREEMLSAPLDRLPLSRPPHSGIVRRVVRVLLWYLIPLLLWTLTDRLWVAWKIRKLHSYQNTNSNSKTKKT